MNPAKKLSQFNLLIPRDSAAYIQVVALTFIATFHSSVVKGDTFQLLGGGSFSGKLMNDPKSAVLKIQTIDGVEMEIPRNRISKALIQGEREKKYISSISAKDDSIESHREAIEVCRTNSQKQLSDAHYERIVELDPSDRTAWAAIGYAPDSSGQWVKAERIQQSRGLVKEYDGPRWTTPHARAIAEVEHKQALAKADISKKLTNALKNQKSNNPKLAAEATAFLNNLADPLAIDAVVSKLKENLKNGGNGELFMRILSQMPGTSASQAFIDLAMNSPNQAIVDQCLELLVRSENSQELAILAFLDALNSKDLKKRDRAGSNLQGLADERCIYTLINSLISKYTRTQSVGGTNTFGSDGGVSASTPGTVTTKHEHPHEPVLQALSMVTGENFGFDQKKWRQWYADKYADTNLNLRRDW